VGWFEGQNVRALLNTGFAQDFTGFHIQVAGVTVDGVGGKRPAVFVETQA
jgi:hypothetical protein